MRPRIAAAAAALALVSATGCSQVAQLQPVAGAQISAVRTATNNVLVEQGVSIQVAPVCEFIDPLFECRGSTTEGAEIRSEAEILSEYGETTDEWGAYVPADVSLVVTVGADTVYDGNVEDVLLRNGQEGS